MQKKKKKKNKVCKRICSKQVKVILLQENMLLRGIFLLLLVFNYKKTKNKNINNEYKKEKWL